MIVLGPSSKRTQLSFYAAAHSLNDIHRKHIAHLFFWGGGIYVLLLVERGGLIFEPWIGAEKDSMHHGLCPTPRRCTEAISVVMFENFYFYFVFKPAPGAAISSNVLFQPSKLGS